MTGPIGFARIGVMPYKSPRGSFLALGETMETNMAVTEQMSRAIELCTQCSDTCRDCARDCRDAGLDQIARWCNDCATKCEATIKTMRTGSAADCASCADMCRRCAEECEQSSQSFCLQCARVCKDCAQACLANAARPAAAWNQEQSGANK